VGREFDEHLLSEFPPEIDPCGENGEFHTFTYAGPMFQHDLSVEIGEIVSQDGFVIADLIFALILAGRLRILASLFAGTLSRQSLFHPALLTRLQIKGVTLHVFNDVFRLNFSLEPSKSIL
jgi:hypothetical protein